MKRAVIITVATFIAMSAILGGTGVAVADPDDHEVTCIGKTATVPVSYALEQAPHLEFRKPPPDCTVVKCYLSQIEPYVNNNSVYGAAKIDCTAKMASLSPLTTLTGPLGATDKHAFKQNVTSATALAGKTCVVGAWQVRAWGRVEAAAGWDPAYGMFEDTGFPPKQIFACA